MFQICILLIVLVALLALLLWLLGEAQARNASHRQRFSPCLEGLEDRIAPSSVQSYDINQGFLPSTPAQFVDGGNGVAYFIATTDQNKVYLYKSTNGANVIPVYNLSDAGATNVQNLFYFNGNLYFTATHPTAGRELWTCGIDGAPGGAPYVFMDINAGANGALPSNYVTDPANGKFYFLATLDGGQTQRISG